MKSLSQKLKLMTAALLAAAGVKAFGSSVEAIQLDLMPIDASISCDRTFFRSPQHFAGTVFMTPQVVAAAGPDNKRLFELIKLPLQTGKPQMYRLNLHLFFPESDEQLRSHGASDRKADEVGCNREEVKSFLNRDITNESDRVQSIANIYLTSLEVNITGIQSTARIGRTLENDAEADILDYNNKTLTATFEITEEERNYFLQQVPSLDGLPAQVKMRFQARPHDGSVYAKVDASSVRANFLAAAKGKVSMAMADVRVALSTAMDSRSLSITTEAGSNESNLALTKLVIDKILGDISLAITDPAAPKQEGAPEEKGLVSVEAVLNVLTSYDQRSVQVDMIGAPETATAQSEIRIKVTNINDLYSYTFDVKADWLSPSTGIQLKANQTLKITVASRKTMSLDYSQVATSDYMNTSDLKYFHLEKYFPELLQADFRVKDHDYNSTTVAEGRRLSPINGVPYFKEIFHTEVESQSYSRWRRTQYEAVSKSKNSNLIPATVEDYKKIPMGLAFSGLGQNYVCPFSNLFVENVYWTATYDSVMNILSITAKRDLGFVDLRELMTEARGDVVYGDPVVLDSVVMENYQPFWYPDYSKPVALVIDTRPIVQQDIYRVYLTPPEEL